MRGGKTREGDSGGPSPDVLSESQHDGLAVSVLLQVSQMVGGSLDLGEVLSSAMDAARAAMRAEACSILLRATAAEELYFYTVKGESASGLHNLRLPSDDRSIAGWVAKHGELLCIEDAYEDARFNPEYDEKSGFRTRSVLCAPLAVGGKQVGVMQVLNRQDGGCFDQWDCDLVKGVASLVAVAIDNAAQHEAVVSAERLATVGQTVAGLAHCIKNILNGLQAGSFIVERSLAQENPSGGLVRGWNIVAKNLRFLSSIVLDMLSYSKSRRPLRQPCLVNTLCQDVVELVARQASEADVSLSMRLFDGAIEIGVDETAIRRCLLNLIGNAIEATKGTEGGEVTLETGMRDDDAQVAIRVRDNGCGMPPEVCGRIFEPLFSTKGNKGTGLGLAVTKKIVEEHEGLITVSSSPGEGTEFILTLPMG